MPISRILKDNHLDRRGRIYAGQHLRVPAQPVKAQAKAARAAASGATTRSYTVRSGDTVSAIAAQLAVLPTTKPHPARNPHHGPSTAGLPVVASDRALPSLSVNSENDTLQQTLKRLRVKL